MANKGAFYTTAKQKKQKILAGSVGQKTAATTDSAAIAAPRSAESYESSYKVGSLLNNVNTFISNYNGDINNPDLKRNGFDAVAFFEDRKKEAEALKRQTQETAKFFEQYGAIGEVQSLLNGVNTDVDEVLGRYELLANDIGSAQAGMRAYEDEIRAEMEQREQYNAMLGKAWNDPRMANENPGWLYNLFQMLPSDASYQATNDQWTDAQRYQLGALYNESPEEARKYAANINQGYDPVEAYNYQEGLKTADLNVLQQEVDQLQAEYDALRNRTEYTATTTEGRMAERGALMDELNRREKELSEKQRYLNLAQREQEKMAYDNVVNNADFAEKSGYVSTDKSDIIQTGYARLDYRDPVYEYINGNEDAKAYLYNKNRAAATLFDNISPEEVAIYNYYYATEGKGKADEYLHSIEDTLNQRRGAEIAGNLEDKTFRELMFAGIAGLDTAVNGAFNLFNGEGEYRAPSATAYAGQAVREDLEDVGFRLPQALGGSSLGQLGYDVVSTTANMAPAMALGAFSPTLGAAAMGATAAGNAYQEALNDGYSKDQARMYSTLVGVSEAAMEKVLGGITELGGDLTKGITRKIVSGVENAVARAALELGGSMISEGFEEGLQEVITPWIKNLTLLTNEDVNWEEVAYSSLLGALSALPMEGPRAAVNAYRSIRSGSSGSGSAAAEEPIATSGKARAVQISTEQEVDVGDFDSIDKYGNATVKTGETTTANLDDISHATETDARRYATVASLPGIEAETANEVLHYLNKNGGAEDTTSIVGIRDAYALGYYGRDYNPHGRESGKIDSTLARAMYNFGQKQAAIEAEKTAKVKTPQTTVTPAEGYKKVVFEGQVAKLGGKKEASVKMMDFIAENFSGTTVHVFESYKRGGKRYYRDNSGVEHKAPNGKYDGNEIWIDLNSGDDGEGLSLNTFGHEMYHHVEKWNKKGAQDLASFLLRELGQKTSVDAAIQNQIAKARAAGYGEAHFRAKGYTQQAAENMVYSRAMSDLVADSLEAVFTHGDPAGALAKLRSENQGLFDQIKSFVDEWVTKLREFLKGGTISEEGAIVANLEKFEQIQQMFMEAMDVAGQNYAEAVASLTPGEEGVVVNENGDPVAMVDEDGSAMLSIRTYEEDGRRVYRDYLNKLVKGNKMTRTDADSMMADLESIYEICKEFKDKYAPFSKWSDAEVVRDTHGRPVFSVVTPNGEYKMNLDFSLVCKKRRTLDAVFNEMARRGIIDDFELGQKSVVKINEIIRKHKFETACALCFVDAKRFRQASMADSFVRLYNELVESLVPEDQRGNISHFNFAGYETIQAKDGIDKLSNSQLDFSHLDDVMKRYGKGTVEHKAAKYINNNPQGRRLLLRGDFMSSKGFDAVKTQNKDILKLYNSKKGTGGPKAAFGDVQYMNEVIRKARGWTPEKAYAVGGVRVQSFSDYVPRMVFDYVQMVYDLAATNLPAHAYTKEALFVKQFGLTGIKINMSLIPAIADDGVAPGLDKNGNYVWAGESFDYDTAVEIQNTDGYTDNCGTICVGVSKAHIEKLLADPNIRMVIPYHKSGLNPIVAHMNKISKFKDYTGQQNTTKDGSKVDKDFDFNNELHSLGVNGDPKAVADKYLKWCAANGYTPKFQEFALNDNYYKLLIDFSVYNKDGNYTPQQGVKAMFPGKNSGFDSMKELIRQGLEEDAIIEGRRNSELPEIVNEIEKSLPRTEAEIEEVQVEQATTDVEEGLFSLRNNQQDNSVRGILSRIDVESRKNSAEREHLGRYQERLGKLKDAEGRLAEIQAKIAEKPGKKELNRLKQQEKLVKSEISNHKQRLSSLEKTDLFKKMVSDQRLVEYKEQQKTKWDAQAEEYRAARKALTGADSVISKMEDVFISLAKDLETQEIDLDTMKAEFILLGVEYAKKDKSSDRYRNEKNFWRREFYRLLKDYDTAGRKIEQLETTILRQRQRAAEKVQSRRNTEMRNKIIRRVGELEKMLLRGSKTSYVPEALRKPVSAILEAIDLRKSDKETKVAQHLKDLRLAYIDIQNDSDPAIRSIFDEGLNDHLATLTKIVGDTKLGDMTSKQMDAVYDIVTAVLETVRNANEAFVSGKRQMVSEMSETAMREVRSIGGNKNQGKVESDLVKGLKAFLWNDMRPVDIFNTIGSGQLKELFNSIRKGEDVWATDIREARDFFRQQWQKFKGDSWDMDKTYTFRSASDMSFQLNIEQIMSIYALFRRDKGQAMAHLRQGGFVFDNSVVDKRGKTHSDATAYNLTDDTIMQIIGTLTSDQRRFVEAMQGYLSDTMGAKGNEVSMKMYGIKLFREKNYFPLRSAEQYMERAKAQQRGEVKIKNSGFTKPVTPNANTAIVLSPFLNAWGSHVDEMSNYHAFVLPMEDFYRVYNYRTDVSSEESATRSVQAAIQNAYGEGAVKAIDQLLKDINGGVRSDSTAGFVKKLISQYKKGATMASLSVAVQQPSAILRAAGMIDAKYLVGPKPTSKTVGRTWEEIKKYAPIATIKEIGSFDTNTGRTATQYLTGMEYNGFDEKFRAFFKDGEFRDEMLGRLPAFMDEVSWSVIWNSVKREQAAKNPGMDTQSDAFMQKVADRFTDVIVNTQVYDSVLAKNAMMRSKESGMKMVTAFMAEPTVTANMIAGAFLNFRRTGDKNALAKTLGSIVASTVVNLAAVSVVYALRDDDEDERFDEKWIASIRNNLFETVSPASYIPILRDMQSIAMGYDVERPDMSVVKGVYEALMSVFDDDIGSWDKVEKVVGAVGNAAGFPAKNLIRDAKGIWNTLRQAYGAKNVSTKTGRQIAWRGEKLDNGEQLLLAIQNGDTAHVERVAGRFESMDKAMGSLMTAIRRQYVEGIMEADEAKELLMTYNELSEDEVYWKLQEWNYAKANGTSDGYTKMGDLMAAVASGEGLEEQIQRYKDNGMDDSDIRSQISRSYHEPYLEADEAGRDEIRKTVGNALRATGSTDTDIADKFKGWDFEAQYGMTYNDMVDGYREGEVTRLQLREAMEFYGMKNFEINEKLADLDGDIAFQRQYGMSLSDMKALYGEGDITRNQMVNALVFSGKSKNEAQEMVTQMDIQNRTGIAYSKLDDAYRAGDISRNTLYNAMLDNGATREEADEAIVGYDWLKRNAQGDKGLTITDAKKFAASIGEKAEGETLEDYGVSIAAYKEYKEKLALCKGVDANGDGKTDDGTLRDSILRMIDSLPISDSAKDGLALLRYSKNSIRKNAPWH